ncbi:MAG: type II toxin-antitoxin system PemK/MazF family toxin [Patescibacteria group bacterium]
MQKDFQIWMELKEKLNGLPTEVLFKEREIWWIAVGRNVGEESNGKGNRFSRPVIVFKKLTHHSFYGIPLTTKIKNGSWYVPFKQEGKENRAMLNQIRVFDSRRLFTKLGTLDTTEWQFLKQKFHDFFI